MQRYRNLDVELYDHRSSAEEPSETYRVRVLNSPAGGQKQARADQVSVPDALRSEIRRLERRELDFGGLITLGKQLGDILLPPTARRLFERSLERLGEDEGLRVRIRLETFALADVPWEYAYIPGPNAPPGQEGSDGFLALQRRISLVRYEVLEKSIPRSDRVARDQLRLVAVLSDPSDPAYPSLDLAEERVRIETAVAEVSNLDVAFFESGTVDDLRDATAEPADIFHFAGHGEFVGELGEAYGSVEGKGFLVFNQADHGTLLFPADGLARNLSGLGVQLAVLSACEGGMRDRANAWTGITPALTKEGIPAVVGMQYSVRDESAIAFTERLYSGLAAGKPIDAAVTAGRLAVMTQLGAPERDWGVPVLYLRTEQPVLFPVKLDFETGRYRANLLLLTSLLALLGLWFYLHVYYWLVSPRFDLAGGAAVLITVLAFLWKGLAPLFKNWKTESVSFVQTILSRRLATKFLGLALSVPIALMFVTSSVYVLYEGAGEEYVVDIRQGDEALVSAVEIRSERVRIGKPIFFNWGRSVDLTVQSPPVYEPEPRNLIPGLRTARFHVPTDLTARDVAIVRLLPSFRLIQLLPDSASTYALRVTAGGGSTVLSNMRNQTIYFGNATAEVEWHESQLDRSQLEVELRHYLDLRAPGVPESVRGQWMTRWLAGPRFGPAVEFEAGDTLRLEVLDRSADSISDTTLVVTPDNGFMNVFLEAK